MRRQKKKRYSWKFALEATRRHVEERTSYRVLAKRYREELGVRVHASTLARMVESVGRRSKTPDEISEELGLHWRGYLIADDKHMSVRGKDVTWYLAVDKTGDILHAEAMKERTVTNMVRFFKVVRDAIAYPMKGLTTDQEALFSLAHRKVYPSKPHQLCLKHALDVIDRRIGYTREVGKIERLKWKIKAQLLSLPDRGSEERRKRTWDEIRQDYERMQRLRQELRPVEELRKMIQRVLYSRRYSIGCSRWANFHRHALRSHPVHSLIVAYVSRRWDSLTIHYHHAGMPKTNNVAENVMKQLERRLKTIEGFGNLRTARSYMNLLVAYLRAKPYTDCKGARKYRNGLSPLQLAGARPCTSDWLKLCLEPP